MSIKNVYKSCEVSKAFYNGLLCITPYSHVRFKRLRIDWKSLFQYFEQPWLFLLLDIYKCLKMKKVLESCQKTQSYSIVTINFSFFKKTEKICDHNFLRKFSKQGKSDLQVFTEVTLSPFTKHAKIIIMHRDHNMVCLSIFPKKSCDIACFR